MQAEIVRVMEECTAASDQERIDFPGVVGKLMQAGVERYHADLLRAEKIYYLPTGESHRTPAAPVDATPAAAFSASPLLPTRSIRLSPAPIRPWPKFLLKECITAVTSDTGP